MINLKPPRRGDDIKADLIRDMITVIQQNKPIAGLGVTHKETPHGTILSVKQPNRSNMGTSAVSMLYQLRVVTRDEVQQVQVYAPASMPLMYDIDQGYFADSALTRDTTDADWISLSGVVSPGSTVYAYLDLEFNYVKFTDTEPVESEGVTPPFVLVGTTTETPASSGKYAIDQAWLGHYCLAGDSEAFTHPWQVNVVKDENGNVTDYTVQIGRVYEADAIGSNGSTPDASMNFCFREIDGSYGVGAVLSLGPYVGTGYLVVDVVLSSDGVLADTYVISMEGGKTGRTFGRIAYIGDGYVEQIAMGDMWRSTRPISVFSTANIQGTNHIYVPSTSWLTINGADWSTQAGLGSPNGTFSDWFSFSGSINLYIRMKETHTAPDYGYVDSVQFFMAPAGGGELITIPVHNGTVGLITGGIVLDLTRPDGHNYLSKFKSLEFVYSTQTLSLEAFIAGTASADPLDDTGPTHMFAMREDDGSGNVYLRWWDSANLKSAIDQEVSDYLGTVDWGTVFGDYWETWYDQQYPDGKFWELGSDYTRAYGSSIGKDVSTMVIDLANQTLAYGSGTWLSACDFFPTTDATFQLGCSDRRWNQGRFNELYTESIGSGTNSVMLIRNDVTGNGCSLGLSGYAFGCAHINVITTQELIPGPNSAIKFSGDVCGTGSCSLGLPSGQGFGALYLHGSGIIYNQDIQIIGQQQSAIADSTDTTDVAVQFNLLLGALRAHGLIAA
jgi:hypothetical protein